MAKRSFKLKLTREAMLPYVHGIWRGVRTVPHWLFIRHSHALDMVAVILVLGIALYLVITLLYLTPPGVDLTAAPPPELHVDTVDELELWIEERAGERQRSLGVPRPNIFSLD